MRIYTLITAFAALLGLPGCAELGARAITEGTYLAEAAGDYVREVHDDRRYIRARCRELWQAQVAALQAEGNFEAAREILAAKYPNLVTFQVFDGLDDGGDALLNYPWPCKETPFLSEALPDVVPEILAK